MDDIKTCPLCGAPGRLETARQISALRVVCTRSTCMWCGSMSKTKEEAISRWNTEWPRRKEAKDG